jgi:folylpolyglutamate synthase/dihydropteroate synthase
VTETPTAADALRIAMDTAGKSDLVLATGSLFLTAEIRESALGIEPEFYPELPPPGSRV